LEEQTAGFTAGIHTAVDAQTIQLLHTSTLDLQPLEQGRDVPDVVEGHVSELHTPFHGKADTEAESVDHVGQVLAAVEASVGVLPHAVDGPCPFRLSQDVFESDLDMVVDVVGVAVDKVQISHGETVDGKDKMASAGFQRLL